MAGGETFNLTEACAGVDFNEARLEKRLRWTKETLARQPEKSVYGSSAKRAEAKAIYNMLGNENSMKAKYLAPTGPRPSGAWKAILYYWRYRTRHRLSITADREWKATDTAVTRPWG
jgi:hypothetical protein